HHQDHQNGLRWPEESSSLASGRQSSQHHRERRLPGSEAAGEITSEQEQAPGPPRTAFPEHPEAHQTVSSIHLYSLPCILSGLGLTDIVIVTVCLCHMVLEGQRLTSCSVCQGWVALLTSEN
ncbi:mCG12031, partial [Mus musculus]